MFGRYRRLVPQQHRDLIKRHRLPRPDWYIGSTNDRLMKATPEMEARIMEIVARVEARSRK